MAETAAKTLLERLGRRVERTSRDRPLPEAAGAAGASVIAAGELLDRTDVPIALAHFAIKHEWAQTLDDLVERRLMLLFHHPLTRRCLEQLAGVLVEHGRLAERERDSAIAATITRLKSRFGKQVS